MKENSTLVGMVMSARESAYQNGREVGQLETISSASLLVLGALTDITRILGEHPEELAAVSGRLIQLHGEISNLGRSKKAPEADKPQDQKPS